MQVGVLDRHTNVPVMSEKAVPVSHDVFPIPPNEEDVLHPLTGGKKEVLACSSSRLDANSMSWDHPMMCFDFIFNPQLDKRQMR